MLFPSVVYCQNRPEELFIVHFVFSCTAESLSSLFLGFYLVMRRNTKLSTLSISKPVVGCSALKVCSSLCHCFASTLLVESETSVLSWHSMPIWNPEQPRLLLLTVFSLQTFFLFLYYFWPVTKLLFNTLWLYLLTMPLFNTWQYFIINLHLLYKISQSHTKCWHYL